MVRPWKSALLFAALVLCAAAGWFFLRTGFFDALDSVQTLQGYLQGFAPYSHLCFFLLQLLSVVLAPIPSNISALAGGLLFGTLPAFLLTFGAVLAGSMLVFALARALGRDFAGRLVSEKLAGKYQEVIRAKTDTFLVLAFLFPFFPDDVLCILAGLTAIPAGRFFLIVLLARPWGLLAASALGGAALSLPFWAVVPLGAAGLVLFLLGMKYGDRAERAVLRRIKKRKK